MEPCGHLHCDACEVFQESTTEVKVLASVQGQGQEEDSKGQIGGGGGDGLMT